MTFLQIYFQALLLIIGWVSVLWMISVIIRDASIIDIFWGLGYVIAAAFYFLKTGDASPRKIIIVTIVTIWGLRLSAYLAWRNIGKGEDFRYRNFRKNYGENRYWWISYFQVFLLQGTLTWLVSAPLLGAQYYGHDIKINLLDYAGLAIWLTGIIFEAGGDLQLTRFRSDPANKGKVLDKGFWRYTRHPNYFGDFAVWWGYGLICMAAGSYIPLFGSLIMTLLLIKVSGVAMLEKTLKEQKPQYKEYIERTSAFFPWFPRK